MLSWRISDVQEGFRRREATEIEMEKKEGRKKKMKGGEE
jgi:hypothetical protein